jgi:predicted DNA-binding WGR domain protein
LYGSGPHSVKKITLTRKDATRNLYRFYRLDVQPDLFGDWCLVKGWGRIGCPSQVCFTPFPTVAEAQTALEAAAPHQAATTCIYTVASSKKICRKHRLSFWESLKRSGGGSAGDTAVH